MSVCRTATFAGSKRSRHSCTQISNLRRVIRSQVPKAEVLAAFPGIVRLLGSHSNVVHSYAAICIERLLSLKVRLLHRRIWSHGKGSCGRMMPSYTHLPPRLKPAASGNSCIMSCPTWR